MRLDTDYRTTGGARGNSRPGFHARPRGTLLHAAAGGLRRAKFTNWKVPAAAIWAAAGGRPSPAGNRRFFLGLNRGKKGISIDLKRPEGFDLCLRLLDKMDVLIENFRPGTMERLGLGYDAVALRNPRLVYCSISGYGQQGPARDEAAMDLIVECSSGFLSITGTEAGENGAQRIRRGRRECRHVRRDRHHDGAARARAHRQGPVRRRVDARRHDLGHELELHDVPGLGESAAPDGQLVS